MERKLTGEETDYTISVLTLNVWGLPWNLTPNKNVRLRAIADKLDKNNFDVVCLQELWLESDFKFLAQLTSKSLPYAHYFHSGVLGSGLAILSKWKFILTFFHQWPVNGYIHMIQHADWFGGKGVGLAQIKFHNMIVNVYNTHLHAQYSENDRYIAHRVVQSLDTGLFSQLTSVGADLTFFCGDLNSEPGDICYNLISNLGRLRDSHASLINEASDWDWGTCESLRISFTNKEILNKNPKGKRLDHIFYRSQNKHSLIPLKYYFPFESLIPNTNISYSDHEAVVVNFLVRKTKDISAKNMLSGDESNMEDIKMALKICYQAMKNIAYNTKFYWILFFLVVSIVILHPLAFQFSSSFYYTVVFPITILLYFFLFMATIWDRIETRGILGAIKRLKTMLNSL